MTLATLEIESEAKVNLFLAVKGLRADGFHEVKTVYQAIDIADHLSFSLRDERITITCNNPKLPTDESNLCYKAAKLLLEETAVKKGIAIDIHKNIPVGGGLAGGSSNAASTLLAVNELCELKLTDEKLLEYGVRLGSDVVFFLRGGTALAKGRGEMLTPLTTPLLWFVIVWPGILLSTPAVYKEWDKTEDQGEAIIAEMLAALETGDIDKIAANMRNDLESPAMQLCPECRELKAALLEAGSLNTMVSGSGSSLFGLARDKEHALKIATKVSHNYSGWIRIARSLAAGVFE